MKKIIGVSCSPRKEGFTSNLVREVLAGVEQETEFISLAGKVIGPCKGCLGCVNDNRCVQKDDWSEMQQTLLEADALVIGAPNYYGMINSLSHAFLERFYAFRHMGLKLKGKKTVLAAVGCAFPEKASETLKLFAGYNELDVVGTVSCKGKLSCLICGNGEKCPVSGARMMYGEDVKITPDMILKWDDMKDIQVEARRVGGLLSSAI